MSILIIGALWLINKSTKRVFKKCKDYIIYPYLSKRVNINIIVYSVVFERLIFHYIFGYGIG